MSAPQNDNADEAPQADGQPPQQPGTVRPVSGIKPPLPFAVTDSRNLPDNWKLFKQKWKNYVTIVGLDTQPRSYQVALFLHTLGDDALRIYNGLPFESNEDTRTVNEIITAFDNFCVGEVNTTYERFVFNSRCQRDGESFDSFISSLRSLVKTCGYCDNCVDSLVRDRVILGIKDGTTQTALLKERNITLARAIDLCKAAENASAQHKLLHSDSVNKVLSKSKQRSAEPHATTSGKSQKYRPQHQRSEKSSKPLTRQCNFCAKTHEMRKEMCPAWGKKCSKCGQLNHVAVKCPNSKKQKVQLVQDERSDSSDTDEWIGQVSDCTGTSDRQVKCRLLVGPDKAPVTFQVDTGATCNILPKKFVSTAYTPASTSLTMWNNTSVQPLGLCRTSVRNPATGKKYSVEFVVVDEHLAPLIGYRASQAMGLVSINSDNMERVQQLSGKPDATQPEVSMFPNVFSGELGTLPGKHTLKVASNVTPVVMPDRRIPLAVRPALKAELDRLTTLEVIEPAEEATPWVSQLVVAKKKSGAIRVCIDPRELNRALVREHYTLPILEDTLHEMRDAKMFTKADLSSGYWHIQLDDESSNLTTFQTKFGRYRWLRLPFGLNVSAEIFQRKLLEALQGLPGIVCIADDVVIYGKDREEHDRHLHLFLKRCSDQGIKLNASKMEWRLNTITFMGHKITSDGLCSDPEKVRAITEMSPPTNVQELRRCLGLVNYLSKFVPRSASVLTPLQNLLKKDVPWNWSESQQHAFDSIKLLITSAPVLAFYDPQKELTLENDASEYGLGSALYQDSKPIAFASRTLTSAERNYAQIEKEMLALCFGLEKFRHYTYGRKVNIITDHNPLVAIVKKPLSKAPKRLQSMLLRSQTYNFELSYKAGKSIPVADALSRSPLNIQHDSMTVFHQDNVAMIAIKDHRLQEIKYATEKDDTLSQLKSVIANGWPQHHAALTPALKPYFGYRDELTTHDGLVLRGPRVVIPASMRKEMKERVHCGHVGINSSIRKAKDLIFWPGMSKEIRQFVESCSVCVSMPDQQPKEPLIVHEIPSRPWEKVATDLFTVNNKNYLITVDYFSNFFEIDYLPDTTSDTVIKKLKQHFARHGTPVTVISDGGPQYTSEIFKTFSEKWGFTHTTSTPGNPQSNGCAESHVKIAKKLMIKSAKAKEDQYLALLHWRNTPTEGLTSSPVQRLMGRRTQTPLPTSEQLLQPLFNTVKSHKEKETKQAIIADRYSERPSLKPLHVGDTVQMQPIQSFNKEWKPATVTKVLDNRSYEVSRDGRTYRRNRRLLRRSAVTPDTVQNDYIVAQDPVQYDSVTLDTVQNNHAAVPNDNDTAQENNTTAQTNNATAQGNNAAAQGNSTAADNTKAQSSVPVSVPYVTRSGRIVKSNPKYK